MRYEVPEPEYLARMDRMLAARAVTTRTLDVDAVIAVLAEVKPLELVPGRRYRIRTYGGTPEATHRHFRDEAGREIALNYPDVPLERAGWIDFEAVYERRGTLADAPWANCLIFRVGTQYAPLADMDIQRIEDA